MDAAESRSRAARVGRGKATAHRYVGILALADYETNLEGLRKKQIERTWFDAIDIGEVWLIPKATSLPEVVEARRGTVVTLGAPRGPVDLSVRVQLGPKPQFSVVETLYI